MHKPAEMERVEPREMNNLFQFFFINFDAKSV